MTVSTVAIDQMSNRHKTFRRSSIYLTVTPWRSPVPGVCKSEAQETSGSVQLEQERKNIRWNVQAPYMCTQTNSQRPCNLQPSTQGAERHRAALSMMYNLIIEVETLRTAGSNVSQCCVLKLVCGTGEIFMKIRKRILFTLWLCLVMP